MASPVASTSAAASTSTQDLPRRLFVGNLASSVDEYSLSKLFSTQGRIAALDFPFHRHGAQKGKPRGYAFVEMSTAEEAMRAMTSLNGRLLRGRSITVTLAKDAPDHDASKQRRRNEPKPSQLSLIKEQRKPRDTTSKISALEAKLSSLASSPFAANGTAKAPPPASLPARPITLIPSTSERTDATPEQSAAALRSAR